MNSKLKIQLTEWIFIIVGWILMLYLYNFMSIWAYRHIMKDNIITEYFDSGLIHVELILGGVVFGILFILINTFTDKTAIRKKSFGSVIFIKSSLYFLSFVFASLLVYAVYQIFGLFTSEQWDEFLIYLTPSNVISLVTFLILSILLMNFFLEINRKFGPGNLLKMMTGRYHSPKDENRIFMFMDLRDSTGIAEKLGHNKYSQLMQNCFYDLTDVLIKYKASVYQYVGDEVVLSWEIKDGLTNLNCIKTYFEFADKLVSRDEFYQKNFKTSPFFKCGLDAGEVTVAEIGEIKREIAYHGDVLNVTARIEKQCTPMKKRMLISEDLEKILPENLNGFNKETIGEIVLKGKREKTMLYSIEMNRS